MTEETPNETGRSIAVRERLVTQAPVAIWDTADFEQMQRVGVVLARSGLVPESLCIAKVKDENNRDVTIELPEQVVAARCVLICNQARLWGADPLNVLQCTSLINGRLMYEGKLVNAIVQHLTGTKLRFELGRWDTDHFEPVSERSELNGIGEALAIRCYDPEDEAREVSGSVGMWKTTRTGSPWSSPGNWPRQMRYRASREWARAYEPGAILGILADGDQEVEFLEDRTPRTSGVMARLSGEQNGAGFDAAHVERETDPKARVAAKRAARKTAAEATPQEAAPAPEPEAPATPAAESPEQAQATQVEQAKEAAELVGLTTPQEAINEARSGTIQAMDDAGCLNVDVITEGYPAENEVYMLNGDGWEFNAERGEERRDTYKNGEPFSDAGRDKGYKVYEDHSPPAAPETAAEEESGEIPADLKALIDATETVESWDAAKDALRVFLGSALCETLSQDQQNHIRASTWEALVDRGVDWLPDHHHDLSAFRLWVEAQDEPGEIKAALALLQADPAAQGKAAALKSVSDAAAARLQALEE